jgi:hypothetical protein
MANNITPKFLRPADEDYQEFDLKYCGLAIRGFKKWYFKKNSKYPARIYAKVVFPPDCPEKYWSRYLVCEINGKPYDITSITREAFDTLTRGITPDCYQGVDFYTIAKHNI